MTLTAALAGGSAAGLALGLASGLALKRTLRAAHAAFFTVFGAGMLLRLSALCAAVWWLRRERYIIIVVFAGTMIAAQTASGLFPLRKDGTKRDN